MTYHDHLVGYLAFYPETVLIFVPADKLAEAQPAPSGVTIVAHAESFAEFRDALDQILARVVWPEG